MAYKLFIASDIHDDVEALDKFADYAQANNSDRIALLGDLSLRPYSSDSLEKLIKNGDVNTFVKEKTAHNNITLNDMKKISEIKNKIILLIKKLDAPKELIKRFKVN